VNRATRNIISQATEQAKRELQKKMDSLDEFEEGARRLRLNIFREMDFHVARLVVSYAAPMFIKNDPELSIKIERYLRIADAPTIHTFMRWYCDSQVIQDEIWGGSRTG
jgi:hypothetical protein